MSNTIENVLINKTIKKISELDHDFVLETIEEMNNDTDSELRWDHFIEEIRQSMDFLLVLALTYNDFARDVLKKEYETNKNNYYNSFKNGELKLKDIEYFYSFSVEREISILKAIGIVEYSHKTNNLNLITDLMKKIYRSTYIYVKNSSELDFMEYTLRKDNQKLEKNQLAARQTAFFYFTEILDLNFRGSVFSIIGLVAEASNRRGNNINIQAKIEKRDNELKDFCSKYNIIYPSKKMGIMKYYQSNLFSKENLIELKNIEDDSVKKKLKNIFDESAFSFYFKFWSNLNIEVVEMDTSYELEPTEIKLCLLYTLDRANEYDLNSETIDALLFALLNFMVIGKQYKNTKTLATIQLEEQQYQEIQKIENVFEKERNRLIKELNQSQEKMQFENVRFLTAKNEIDELKRELKNEKIKIKDLESHNKEIKALRKYIENQKDIEKVNTIPVENMLEKLQNEKVIIIGGHERLLVKLKEILPKMKFLHLNDINKDFKVIHSFDYVYLNVYHLNHGVTLKLTKEIENSDLELIYAPDHDNLNILVKHLYDSIYKQ